MDFPTTFSPPAKDHSAEQPTSQLRKRAACSLVKQHLLGNRHRPFEAQQTAMAKALQPYVDGDGEFRGSTWNSWWTAERDLKAGSLDLLDRASGKPKGFIRELVLGGMLGKPLSPLHAHFDALDAAGYFGRPDDDWEAHRREIAMSVLRHLHQKWRPNRNHQVPGALPKSSFKVEQDALPNQEEEAVFRTLPLGYQAYFKRLLNTPDSLSQSTSTAYDLQSPACMPEFLFAIGHDIKFMSLDKIDIWALDLATASLALWGLLYADRYDTVLGSQQQYSVLWQELHALFWEDSDKYAASHYDFLLHIVGLERTTNNYDVIGVFAYARMSYTSSLEELGLHSSDINAVIDKSRDARKIVLVPKKMLKTEQ